MDGVSDPENPIPGRKVSPRGVKNGHFSDFFSDFLAILVDFMAQNALFWPDLSKTVIFQQKPLKWPFLASLAT